MSVTTNITLPCVLPAIRSAIGITPIAYEPEALAYFSNNGITDPTARNQINSFIKQLKQNALFDKMVSGVPLRLAHMSASGTTTYGIKGTAVTLVNGIERNVNGIKSTALYNQYLLSDAPDVNGQSMNGYYMVASYYVSITDYVTVDPLVTYGVSTTYAMQLAKRLSLTNSFRGVGQATIISASSVTNNAWHTLEGIVTGTTGTLYVDRANEGTGTFTNFSGPTTQITINRSTSSGIGYYIVPFAGIFKNFTESDRTTLKTILDSTLYTGLTIP